MRGGRRGKIDISEGGTTTGTEVGARGGGERTKTSDSSSNTGRGGQRLAINAVRMAEKRTLEVARDACPTSATVELNSRPNRSEADATAARRILELPD